MTLELPEVIANMRYYAMYYDLDVPDLSYDIPPAFVSLQRSILNIPFELRDTLVKGLPEQVQKVMLADIDPSSPQPLMKNIIRKAMHVDATLWLKEHILISPDVQSIIDEGCLYQISLSEDTVHLLPQHPGLPSFVFPFESFERAFIPNDHETIVMNAYIYRRWYHYTVSYLIGG